MVECDICGAKAIYYRRSSGHKLCAGCLRRALERSVRKFLGPLGVLRPSSYILIPITYYNTLISIGLADLSLSLKRGYGSSILIAIPDFVVVRGSPRRFHSLSLVRTSVEPRPCHRDPILAIHYDRLWSLKIALHLGFNAILLPLTRTDITLLSLEIPLRGYDEAWSILEPITESSGIALVNALASVEAEAIASYTIISGYDISLVSDCSPKLEMSRVYRELRGLGPEVEFSSYKAVKLLKSLASSRLQHRCPYCGGFSRTKGLCALCEDVEASKLRASLS